MTNTTTIIRTRDRNEANDLARRLAGATGRAYGIRRFDARTSEVFSQRAEIPKAELNALQKMAALLRKTTTTTHN